MAVKLALLKKIAIILSILVAVVILFLPYSGSFSQNNATKSIGRPQYTHRASQPSSATKTNNKIKDFAVDVTIDQPSRWISRGKHEFKGLVKFFAYDYDCC